MKLSDKNIDHGNEYDWGLVSKEYAKFRDIYPEEFYQKIVQKNLCVKGQNVLDVGTGTGVIPRNMARFGAKWTGTDITDAQIEQAKQLSKGLNIDYQTCATEALDFPENSFDVITACQCFFYFDHAKASEVFNKILKPNGKFLAMYMAWLPFEDEIAKASEDLVYKYNPEWTSGREEVRPLFIPSEYDKLFTKTYSEEYKVKVHFTKETWHGRIKASRGVGASLSPEKLQAWETEHLALLDKIAPNEFDIQHYVALAMLEKKDSGRK